MPILSAGDTHVEEIRQMILDCESRSERLNTEELHFIDSITRQFGSKQSLSPKQMETLDNIWAKATAKG